MRRNERLNLAAIHSGFTYQLQAVEAVKGMEYAALFHEQGLGKTKIGIDLALDWLKNDVVDAILFVTKRGLIANWSEEMRAHSHLRPRILDQNHSSNFFALNSPSPVLLTHYEVLKTEERRLALYLRTRRVGVILDEAHKIKNPDTAIAKALRYLVADILPRPGRGARHRLRGVQGRSGPDQRPLGGRGQA
jgi:SNF2 family DNA or RNA helicase